MVFRLKKEYSPMKTITATTSRKGYTIKKVFYYPPYEDLTKDTYNLVQALQRTPGPVRCGPLTGTFVSDWMETQQSRKSPQCTTLWSPFLASRTFSK
jgi:hypothetical protein